MLGAAETRECSAEDALVICELSVPRNAVVDRKGNWLAERT